MAVQKKLKQKTVRPRRPKSKQKTEPIATLPQSHVDDSNGQSIKRPNDRSFERSNDMERQSDAAFARLGARARGRWSDYAMCFGSYRSTEPLSDDAIDQS